MADGGTNTRYEIIRKIARGGMGEVYLARHFGIGGFTKDVVLKRIHDSYADDPEFVTMFLQEARIAALLDHPNIVQIYGLGQQVKSYFIIMEYVPGLSLSRLLKRVDGPLPEDLAIQIAADLAAGLHFAHEKRDSSGDPLNLVHRDVSPPNILLSTAGGVKLTDFGIAKVKWSTTHTRAGVVKGKYSYLAPEQVRGETADRQSDLYSLGLNLYEMTTGQRAYPPNDHNVVLRAVAKGKIPPPEEHIPEYPRDLRVILMQALAVDRKRRYADCSQFQEDLLNLLVQRGVAVSPARLGQYVQRIMDGTEEPILTPPVSAKTEPLDLDQDNAVPEEEHDGATVDLRCPTEEPLQDTQILEMATLMLKAAPAGEPAAQAPTAAEGDGEVATASPEQTGPPELGVHEQPTAMLQEEEEGAASSEGLESQTSMVGGMDWRTFSRILVLFVGLGLLCLGIVFIVLELTRSSKDPTGRPVSVQVVSAAQTTASPAGGSGATSPDGTSPSPLQHPSAAGPGKPPATKDRPGPDVKPGPAAGPDRPEGPDSPGSPRIPGSPGKRPVSGKASPPVAPRRPIRPPRALPKVKLSVTTDPVTDVYLGRRRLGRTPLTTNITRETTRLVFQNRALGLKASRTLNPQGTRVSTQFVFRKGRIAFQLKTSKEILLDGKKLRPPPAKPLQVYEGDHIVTIIDPKTRRRQPIKVTVLPNKTVPVVDP